MLKVGQVEGTQKILSNNFPINNIFQIKLQRLILVE